MQLGAGVVRLVLEPGEAQHLELVVFRGEDGDAPALKIAHSAESAEIARLIVFDTAFPTPSGDPAVTGRIVHNVPRAAAGPRPSWCLPSDEIEYAAGPRLIVPATGGRA